MFNTPRHHQSIMAILLAFIMLMEFSILNYSGQSQLQAAEGPPGTLIVLNKSDASAWLIRLKDGQKIADIPTGDGPHEVAVSPDGKLAVVTNYGGKTPGNSLTVIDIPNRSVVKTIDLGEYARPHGILFFSDGKRVAVTAEARQSLLIVDVPSGKIIQAIPTNQETSHMVALAPDEKRAFVANIRSNSISVLDIPSGKLEKIIPTGAGAEGIAVTPDGTHIWVSNRAADTITIIDATNLNILRNVPCPGFPIRVQMTARSPVALVSCARAGDVKAFNWKTGEQVATIKMNVTAVQDTVSRLFRGVFGESPVPIGVLIHPSGRRAYVANSNADVVVEMDLNSWEIVRFFRTGKQPDGLGFSPISD
ncbi:MAG: beta-propeller fold lactonase family protein [Calditrichaeota bacterium]|nr:beta-propeller fold lactonase family protein [Calditrichota bacterium]